MIGTLTISRIGRQRASIPRMSYTMAFWYKHPHARPRPRDRPPAWPDGAGPEPDTKGGDVQSSSNHPGRYLAFTASAAATARLNARRFSPDSRATLAKERLRGFTDWPLRHISQCRCGPVDSPVDPT